MIIYRPIKQATQTRTGIELTSIKIGTECILGWKSTYCTIAGTTVLWSPKQFLLMCKAPTMWWEEWSSIHVGGLLYISFWIYV